MLIQQGGVAGQAPGRATGHCLGCVTGVVQLVLHQQKPQVVVCVPVLVHRHAGGTTANGNPGPHGPQAVQVTHHTAAACAWGTAQHRGAPAGTADGVEAEPKDQSRL